MAKRKQTEELVEKLLEPIAEARGVRIYDVEYVKEGQEYYLRAYIDKDGGVTIDDCVDVSHDLSDALDAADPIPEAYTLEVSARDSGEPLQKTGTLRPASDREWKEIPTSPMTKKAAARARTSMEF